MTELREINGFMDDLAPNIEVLWGLYRDNTLGEDVKVTLIATDFEKGETSDSAKRDEDKDRLLKDALVATYYGENVYRRNIQQESKVEKEDKIEKEVELKENPKTDEIEVKKVVEHETFTSSAPSHRSFIQRFLERLDKLMDE
jgi:cell division protein FtsZ